MLELKPIFHALMRSKIGALLLLVQIAITTAIVSNAAFIIADRVAFLNQPTGYPEQEIFRFNVLTFGKDANINQQLELDEQMLRDIPNVIDAAYTSAVPISGSGSATSFHTKPKGEEGDVSIPTAYYLADNHFLNTVGVKLKEGRNFREDEVIMTDNLNEVAHVVILSEKAAKGLFKDEPALGKTVYMGGMPLEVIGISEHLKAPWLRYTNADNIAIIPYVNPRHIIHFLVRTKAEHQQEVMAQIEQKMLANYNKRVVSRLEPLTESKRTLTNGDVLMTRMLITLIVILVLITALGIFGLTVFNISKRTKQIGTRRALGARKSAIMRYFLLENAMVSLVGLAIGCVLAWGLGKQLMSYFSVPALSWQFVLCTALGMFAMSLLAVLSPAKRAADISPSIATRSV